MSWYNLGGKVQQVMGATDLFYHDVLRIPNWPTEAAAKSHPYTLNTAQAAGLGGVIGAKSQPVGQAAQAASTPQTSIPSAFGSINKILNSLTSRHTLIRLAEGIAGIALIIVAVDKLASGTQAGKIAHTGAKAAFLA